MPRGAIYARVSTEEQATKGLSIDVQVDTSGKQVKSDNCDLLHTLTDEGYSGGSLKRPAIQRLIELVKSKSIDRVYMTHSDRMSRNVEDHYYLRRLFREHGVSIVYVMQPNLGNEDAMSKTSDGMFAVMN